MSHAICGRGSEGHGGTAIVRTTSKLQRVRSEHPRRYPAVLVRTAASASRVGTVHRAFVPWILERLHHRTWCAPQQIAYVAYTRGWARARRQPEPDSDWGPQTAPQAPCSAIARRSVASGVVLTRGAPHAPPGAGTWSSFRPCWRRVGPSLTAWRPSYIHTWLSSGPPHRVCGHTRPFAILYMTGAACFVSL